MYIDIKDPAFGEKSKIVQALGKVTDPELGVNIVDLGLVYEVRVDMDLHKIFVDMTLSTPSCPMGAMLTGHVAVAGNAVMPGYETIVTLVWEPKWHAGLISEEGKAMLGW